ncbi:MAG: 3-hydroxyacyl-CoA dehydrogenase family protein [Halodesulfurarchaeum sp.]
MAYDVSVIGGGIMGQGLALHFATQDQNVTVIEHRQSNLDRARKRIAASADTLGEMGVVDRSPENVLDEIDFTLDREAGVRSADVVLETISEDLEAKHDVFEYVAETAPDDAILASNTSGLRIRDIAGAVPDAADRVVGCHWWNPPYLMPLVEVVRGPDTAPSTVERTEAFVETVDRNPIRVNADVPGIVWNRIQFAVLRECMHLLDEGVASLLDINAAVRDGYARRTAAIGPFETVDLSGLELFREVAAELYPHLSTAESPSDRFDEYIERGRTGVEAGSGFFDYDESAESRTRYRDEQLKAIGDAIATSRRSSE